MPRPSGPVVQLGGADQGLAEVIATELPALRRAVRAHPAVRVEVRLGRGDILDGFDESYIHARVVELLDLVAELLPPGQVGVCGLPDRPEADARQQELRRQVDAGAATTARLRGQTYTPHA